MWRTTSTDGCITFRVQANSSHRCVHGRFGHVDVATRNLRRPIHPLILYISTACSILPFPNPFLPSWGLPSSPQLSLSLSLPPSLNTSKASIRPTDLSSPMACLEVCMEVSKQYQTCLSRLSNQEAYGKPITELGIFQGKYKEEKGGDCTLDGTVDWKGQPAIKGRTGQWVAGAIILCKLSVTCRYYDISSSILFFFRLQHGNELKNGG